jgi:heme/copper-type cytochrome/quinol oxidase subunit 2
LNQRKLLRDSTIEDEPMNSIPDSLPSFKRSAVTVLLIGSMLLLAGGVATAQDEGEGAEQDIPTKHIKMDAENWQWIPNKIRVVEGTKVIIDIKNVDAPHRFDLKAYRLKVKLPQDKTTRVEFVADKPGEFMFYCGRPCGDGCPKMAGKLYVVAREEGLASD